ncbi:hypothetical protein L1987_61558 [Smallanthus sonchifolius]|uniref:Uncharacterized protein n=1 Tax=Smallanthus sonchifolius TaxID=185202 RepID=A0ACB9C7Z7_9ASTR|nr:hypothetical protein L1987_61558 [Smallanthus sonchifolius]
MLSCYSSTAQPFDLYPTANLSTSWTNNGSLIDFRDQLILLRQTSVAQFACGFFCEGDCTSFVFAIFISGINACHRKVVWSANRDYPVGIDATLNFTAAGELVLSDADGSIVWTTNTAGKSVAGMNLTDTGNLVLFDDKNSVVWQSFDHPTDCLLLGQELFIGQKLKSSVPLTNSSEVMYSLQVTGKGLFANVESNPPQSYYSWVVFGDRTNKGRTYMKFLSGSLSFFINSSETSYPDAVIDIPQASSAQYMQLMPDGHLQVFEWQSASVEWAMVSDVLTDKVGECGYPLTCGRNSICSTNQQCSCPGIEYFRPVNERQPNLGCSEITPLTCNSTPNNHHFIRLEKVEYFNSTADMDEVNMDTCKQACLNNCSCKAAFFRYSPNASSGECFLPSEIFTMKTVDRHDINALAYIKVKNVALPPSSHQVARVVGSTIGSFVLVLVVAIGFITYLVHKRKRDAEMEEGYLDQVPGMPNRFPYEELRTATENFSKKLGEGGFGSVFEGSLKDASKIAVKRLEGLTHIQRSFLAEVQSIGSIHHVNLVRLRGFCTWKSQRFLVYDFMCNGSLDRWIYHGNRERILEWECRKKIILDIAKGLAYLHEDCRQKIVHLDIKPQNILLDKDFNAKVSDFGSEPEESSWHLLFVFQKCWEQGTLLDMVDRHSEDMQVCNTEVLEMMKVASWCLQTNFKRRPSMSSVVKVLEGGMNVESNLNYNFTDPRMQEPEIGDEKDFTRLPPSLLSGPR